MNDQAWLHGFVKECQAQGLSEPDTFAVLQFVCKQAGTLSSKPKLKPGVAGTAKPVAATKPAPVLAAKDNPLLMPESASAPQAKPGWASRIGNAIAGDPDLKDYQPQVQSRTPIVSDVADAFGAKLTGDGLTWQTQLPGKPRLSTDGTGAAATWSW